MMEVFASVTFGLIANQESELAMSDFVLILSRMFNIFVFVIVLIINRCEPKADTLLPSTVILLNSIELIAADWLYFRE